MQLDPTTLLDPPKLVSNKPYIEVLHPSTALNGAATYDPDKEFDLTKEIEHPASFDLDKIMRDPTKTVDAQIMECDPSGRYRLASYNKEGLAQRLRESHTIEATPTRPITLREAVVEKYAGVLREDFGMDDSLNSNFSEPFANFTPLFIGPYYRQQYMYKMLEAKSKIYDAWVNNPVAHRIPLLITQFTLGKGVTVTTHDDTTKEVWNKFSTANKIGTAMHTGLSRAGSRLRMWSNQLSVDGESMFQFFETPENLIVKALDTATILDIITDPEDIEKVFYLHQQFCLVGDTQIKLIDGTNPTIEEMTSRYERGDRDMWVYSYDHEKKKIVPGHVTWASNQGKKRCVEVTIDNGEKIVASFDHPFLLRDGTYVWAENLKPGTSLMPLYTRSGYEELYQPTGVWEATHQIVARELVDPAYERGFGKVVHHVDGDRRNNHPSNIEVMSKSEHTRLTIKERWEDPSSAGETYREHWKRKSSRSAKKTWKSPSFRAMMAKRQRDSWKRNHDLRIKALKATWADPEVRAKRVAGLQKSWKDPVKKAARCAKLKKAWELRRTRMAAEEKVKLHNHKVVSVREVGMRTVFDLTVDKHHNFALKAGVFTHNTTRFQQYVTNGIPSINYIVRQIPGPDVLHYKLNCYENEVRGRSDLFSVIGWIKRLKDLVNANVLKAYFQACYTYDVTVDGSPDTVKALAASYKNHVPTPGAQYVHNKNITRTPMPPVGAVGAGTDNDMVGLMNLISLGTGIPPAYLIGTMAQNRAGVLTETEPSTKFFFERQCVWDEIFHGFFDRLSRWHYKNTGQMLDENIEFTFPAVNAIEKQALIQSLTLMRDNEWFADDRCAEIAAKEWNVTSYNLDSEREKIQEEKKRKVQDSLNLKQAESAAQSRLSFYQNMLSDAHARANEEQFGYDPQTGQGADSAEAQAQDQQSQEMQQQEQQQQQQAQAGKQTNDTHRMKLEAHKMKLQQHQAKLKQAGGKRPDNAPRRPETKQGGSHGTKGRATPVNSGRSSSGGLTEKERKQTRKNISAKASD